MRYTQKEVEDNKHIYQNISSLGLIEQIIKEPNYQQEDSFYVLELSDIVNKLENWNQRMPRVKPFYAIKCNDNEDLLKYLANTDIGFDCASKGEIKKMMSFGVSSSRIIYANPCKQNNYLEYASSLGIDLMTFDNEEELFKIKKIMPQARLLLRISSDAKIAECLLGEKFGCKLEDSVRLLEAARKIDLNVIGVAFHVGTNCGEPAAYHRAIEASRKVFDQAKDLGFLPHMLNIGGGFPDNKTTIFDECAHFVNTAIEEYFPESNGVQIIAEPGRYIATSAFTIAVQIIGKRENGNGGQIDKIDYYVNDGKYGSFLWMHEDLDIILNPVIIRKKENNNKYERLITSAVFGQSCDSLDKIIDEINLPILDVGDWLIWKDFGAYALTVARKFNGFPLSVVYTIDK